MLRPAVVDRVGDLEHGHVDAVGNAGHRDLVAGRRTVERARENQTGMGGAGAAYGARHAVGELRRSESGGAHEAAEDAGVRAVEHDLGEIGGRHPGVGQGAGERVDQERREDAGAEALLPLLGEGHAGALPHIEHLFGAGGASDQAGDRLAAAEDEGCRRIAAAGLAGTARSADDHVAGSHQQGTAGRRHVQAGQKGRKPGAARTAEIERRDRLGQVRCGLQRRRVQLLAVRGLVEANTTVSTAAPSGNSRSASREASTAIEAESSS